MASITTHVHLDDGDRFGVHEIRPGEWFLSLPQGDDGSFAMIRVPPEGSLSRLRQLLRQGLDDVDRAAAGGTGG